MTTIIQLGITFESLVEAIASLDLEKKHQLLEILEDLLFEAEEDLLEQNPQVVAEIEEARQAYQMGDYQTIQQYLASQSKKTS
jgi:gamma-glutamyl phosphate reductase